MNEIEFVYIRVPEEIILYADPAPLLIIEETQVLIHRPPLRMAQHDRFSLTLGFLSKGRDGEKNDIHDSDIRSHVAAEPDTHRILRVKKDVGVPAPRAAWILEPPAVPLIPEYEDARELRPA